MKKVFTKIAGLSVGLAMAIGVGVAIGGRSAKVAKATEAVAYTLDGTVSATGTGYNADNETTQNGIKWIVNGNINQTPWRIGGNSKNGTSEGVDRYAYSDSALSLYDISKVVFNAGTVNITVNSFKLIVSSEKKGAGTVTDELTGSITASQSTTFTRPSGHDWSNKFFTFVFNVTNTTTSNKYVQFSSAVFYHEVSGQSISVPSTAIAAVGKTISVDVTYVNIAEGGIAVTAGSEVSVPATLNVSGSGSTSLSITGVSEAESVTVTLSAGTATESITVSVIDPYYYYLVDDVDNLTDGSIFTIIAGNNNKLYYPHSFNTSYYETAEVLVSGSDFVGIEDAIEFELDVIDGEKYIAAGDKYLGSTSVADTAKLQLTDDHSSNYSTFVFNQVTESTKVEIQLNTEDSGNAKRINFNVSNGRLANYSVNTASLVYVYAKYLAPALRAGESSVTILDNEQHDVAVSPVNFGGESVSYNVASGDSDVANGAVSDGYLTISPAGVGSTTLTVTATSANHTASAVINVTVNSSERELDHLSLSLSADSLYKGQEFVYNGTVTAVYDNDDEVELDADQVEFSGYNMSTTGNQIVTVSYTDGVTKSTSYTLTVSQWTGELTLGNYYVLASIFTDKEVDYQFAMVDVGKIGTANVGIAAEYGSTLRSESALLVEAGSTYNSYAFKLGTGKYLTAANSNTLNTSDDVTDASSWTVTASGDNFVITNVGFERSIKYNASSPRFAAYGSGQKDVTLIPVSYADVASHFMTNFMHPEIDFDDKGSGECKGEEGYYAKAKAAFNVMPEESRNFFMTSTIYTNYKARLAAWAAANGDEFSEVNLLVSNPVSRVAFDTVSDNKTVVIVISIAAISALAFTTLLVFKKKRQK